MNGSCAGHFSKEFYKRTWSKKELKRLKELKSKMAGKRKAKERNPQLTLKNY